MACRSISRLRTVIRRVGLLGLLAIDLCPVALIVLVAPPLCTTLSAQDLPSNTDRPTPEEPQTPVGTPASSTGTGSEDTVAAAKDAAQNPLASTISVPFQNNTFFNVGPYRRTENGLIIEPVIPFKLNENWNLITRTILPVIYQPQVSPSQGSDFGLGNINPQFFLSPARSGQIIWGGGPQLWLPTATNKTLGVNKFGGGPAVVALTKRGHWLVGTLVGNVWAGTRGTHYNQMTITPLVFYNMQKGWYVMYVAMITANWVGSATDRWTVPVGAGFGRVFKIGKQPVNARTQIFNNVLRPNGGPAWTLQTQVQFVFIKK